MDIRNDVLCFSAGSQRQAGTDALIPPVQNWKVFVMSYDWFLEKLQRGEISDPLLKSWCLGKGVGDLSNLARELNTKERRLIRRKLAFMIGGLVILLGSFALIFNRSSILPSSMDSVLAAGLTVFAIGGLILFVVGLVREWEDDREEIFRGFKKDWKAMEEFFGSALVSQTFSVLEEMAALRLVTCAQIVLRYEQESEPGMENDQESEAKKRFKQAHRVFQAFGLIKGGFKPFFDQARANLKRTEV